MRRRLGPAAPATTTFHLDLVALEVDAEGVEVAQVEILVSLCVYVYHCSGLIHNIYII